MISDSPLNVDTKYSEYPDFFDVGTLSIALIGPDESLRNSVARALVDCRAGGEVREFPSYPPSLDDVPRLLEERYNVIIIDLESNREYALELVESICANGVATVMVYTSKEDPELILQCMRAGVRDILTLPFTQSTVAAALIRAAARRPAVVPRKETSGRMLAFLGSKGGAGVTTIACNFAVALAQDTSQSTLLIDLDLPLGDAALNLGLEAEYSTISALQEYARLDRSFLAKLLVEHSSGLKVLAAPGKFPAYQASSESVDKLLTVARQNFDNVVIDIGSKLDFAGTALLKDARTVYLITQASVPELRNSHRLINQYFSGSGSSLEIVVNRYQPHSLGVSDEHITKALTRPVQWKIPNDFAAVRQMQNTATPIVLGDSSLSRRIREMASVITGQPVPQAKKKGFSFKSLGRGDSTKNDATKSDIAEEVSSTPRLIPRLNGAASTSSSPRPTTNLNAPEPSVYTPPSRTLIPAEPLTVSETPEFVGSFEDADIENEKGDPVDSSSNNNHIGPETRIYKGSTYVKGVDGKWHLQGEEPVEAAQEQATEPVLESPEIDWPAPAPIAYGTALGATQLNATSKVAGRFEYAPAKGFALPTGTHTIWVTFIPADRERYATVQAFVSITVTMATPIILWPTPAAVPYGTPLSKSELNATSLVPGVFAYTPSAGEVLPPGTHTLTVNFTPADGTKYTSKQASVSVIVKKTTPTINWLTPEPISFGTALSARELNATASVEGSFSYTPGVGAVLAAGTHTPSVFFVPAESEKFTNAHAAVSLTVTKAEPTIHWATPAAIAYGTALSDAELNATASVAGTFTYSPSHGEVLTAGMQTLSATFNPADTVDYTTATATVSLSITQGEPTRITWPTPSEITFGTALSEAQLNATASEPGTYNYSPSEGDLLTPGTHTLKVVFTPTDSNFPASEASVSLEVRKATPAIEWPTPAPIPCGTALGTAELNATASVPGSFDYAPPAGDVPRAGVQTLRVTFTPKESENYTAAEAEVKLTVTRAKPMIAWPTPSPISYGTPLSDAEFNAKASVPGTFVFTPAKGTVLTTGTQTLEAIFTPEDTGNYDTARASVSLLVTTLAQMETLTPPSNERGRDEISDLVYHANHKSSGETRRIQGSSAFEETPVAAAMAMRFGQIEKSIRNEDEDSNSRPVQSGSTNNQPVELETRTYRGSTYVKGTDGQWHLKQD
ncbi:MAG: AAA family ATPase [Terracidiphilus sp.]